MRRVSENTSWHREFKAGDDRIWHRCSGCGRPIPGKVRRCSSRRCPAYSSIWAQDTRRRLFENLKTLKLAVMFSVTAPGKDLFPFDPERCSHGGGVTCSGEIGCRVHADAAQSFNSHVSPWWSELHRVAKLRADRATGFKGTIAARVWEKQKRGLAHMHGVLSVSTPAELRWAEAYVNALSDRSVQRIRLRRRVGEDPSQDEAGRRRGGILVGLLRERQGAEGVAHRERPGRRSSTSTRVHRARPDHEDRLHNAQPSTCSPTMGVSRRARTATGRDL